MRCGYCHNADMFDFDGGKEMSAEEIAAFCARYKSYYGQTGGATLSGGEPLAQADFALEVLNALKAQGIHTALDTSGAVYAPKALAAADLVLLDIKHTDKDMFLRLTGQPIDNTLKTLSFLQKKGKPFWVRQVIVQGHNDTVEQVSALKALAEGAQKIQLLPFHSMGAHKWEKAGLTYPFKNAQPPSEKVMQQLRNAVLN